MQYPLASLYLPPVARTAAAILLALCGSGAVQALGTPGAASGPALRHNLFVSGKQHQAAIASDADGNAVSVWYSSPAAGSPVGTPYGLRARLLDSAGTPLGDEIVVNSTPTAGSWFYPEVAMDQAGNFTVVWSSLGTQMGSLSHVYRRRFDSFGNPLELQQQLDIASPTEGASPAIAMTPAGAAVVVWKNYLPTGVEIRARRFDSAGVAQGADIVVAAPGSNAMSPELRVALDDSGNFTVVWTQDIADGAGQDVYRRRFSAAGAALGPVQRTQASGSQSEADIGMDAAGNSVVVCNSLVSRNNSRILGRRYDAAGNAVGGEFILAYQQLHPAYEAMNPAVAMVRSSGDFSVAWNRRNNTIYLRRYAANGSALGDETAVSSGGLGLTEPRIASDYDGDISLVWRDDESSYAQDYGVMGRRIAGFASVDLAAQLSATLESGSSPAAIDYQVTVANLQAPASYAGARTATGVVAVLTPPAGGLVVQASGDNWYCDTTQQNPRCTYLPAISAGGSSDALQVRVGGVGSGTVQASVQVSGNQYDAAAGNDSNSVTLLLP